MTVGSGVPIRDALDSAVVAIGASGSPTARLDAEMLLAHVLAVRREELFLHPEREVVGPAVRAFQQAVRERAVLATPVAYLIGRRGFRYLDLAVDARALIPRPETELLVEVGLELRHGACVVDIGTGSGAIALALRDERPDLEIIATDVSADALALARENADRLGLQVTFAHGDLLEALADETRAVDAILCNPPYVAEADRASLPRDVVAHEPPAALFAGADGLDVLRRLIPGALARAPLLAVELGVGQAARVAAMMRAAGADTVECRRDLAGIDRVVIGRRDAAPRSVLGDD